MAAAIAKRGLIVAPVCHSVFLTANMMASLGTMLRMRQCLSRAGSDSAAIVEYVHSRLGLRDVAARRHAIRQPDIAADRRTLANRDASENCGSRVDDHIVF